MRMLPLYDASKRWTIAPLEGTVMHSRLTITAKPSQPKWLVERLCMYGSQDRFTISPANRGNTVKK